MAFQATVVLTAITPGIHPKQRILELDADNSTVPIGRASKSPNKGLTGKVDNGWFDSPVMSREHAELWFDAGNKSLFLKDVKSMHGTRLNGSEIPVMMHQVVKDGDKIVFGAEVRRGFEIFPACEFLIEYYVVPQRSNSAAFEVPYGSDIEEEPISEHDYYNDDEQISTTSPHDDETPVESPVQKLSVAVKSVEIAVTELKGDNQSSGLEGHIKEQFSENHVKDEHTSYTTASCAQRGDLEDSDICDSEQESEPSEQSLGLGEDTDEINALQLENEILDSDYGDDNGFEVNDSFTPDGSSDPQDLGASMQTFATMAEDEQTHAYDDSAFELKSSALRTSTLPLPWQAQPDGVSVSVTFNKFATSSAKGPINPNSIILMDDLDLGGDCGFARTPSPSDAAMVKKINSVPVHHLPHQQWQEFTSAQILGEKSGKHAYFAAREDNKAMIGTARSVDVAGNEWTTPWSRSGQQLPPLTPIQVHDDQAQITSPSNKDRTATTNAQAIVFEANRAVSPDLDMTSAASFAESKALLEQHRPYTRSGVSIDDLVEHPIQNLKRKASGISEDEPNRTTELREDVSVSHKDAEEATTSGATTQNAPGPLEQHPAKKLRRLAEAVGYAAIGGVAVGAGLFSILVATAPDFA